MKPASAKTLIIYQTRYGTTTKVSETLAEKFGDDTVLINLKKEKVPALEDFERVIIGGSIRASVIQSGIKKYMATWLNELKTKQLGLFLVCMEDGDTAQKQFDDSFPEELRSHAKALGLLGGEFNFDKLNFLERGIVKKITGITESVSKIKHEKIDLFVDEMSA